MLEIPPIEGLLQFKHDISFETRDSQLSLDQETDIQDPISSSVTLQLEILRLFLQYATYRQLPCASYVPDSISTSHFPRTALSWYEGGSGNYPTPKSGGIPRLRFQKNSHHVPIEGKNLHRQVHGALEFQNNPQGGATTAQSGGHGVGLWDIVGINTS